MFKKKLSQSQSITGNQISGSQIQLGQTEGNLTQTQQDNQASFNAQPLAAADVVKLLAEIQTLIQQSALPNADKGFAIK